MKKSTVSVVAAAFILLAAHLLHGGYPWLALGAALAPLSLLASRPWAVPVLALTLGLGMVSWLHRAASIVMTRFANDLPWLRAAVIMTAAITIVAAAIALLIRESRSSAPGRRWPGVTAFTLAAALLVAARLKAPMAVIMADRFIPGTGWLEIALLALYAAWLTDRLADPAASPRIRLRVWTAFSVVFFTQALLGLAGFDRFLMTGSLHVPVPAVIIGGPLFRGEGFFMTILFTVTLVFVGPAWCSWLCYFGAGDNRSSLGCHTPGILPRRWHLLRLATLALVVLSALGMRAAGVPAAAAAAAALAFGLAGIAIMIALSRRRGLMLHCTAWCPLGLVADLAGKLSPFRIAIGAGCVDCQACTSACRYGALEGAHIAQRRPGITCTLCGDCLPSCRHAAIGYRFPGLSPDSARRLFLALVTALHAASLGLARL